MGFDPSISEWGNPPVYILLLLRDDAHAVPALAGPARVFERSGHQDVRPGIIP